MRTTHTPPMNKRSASFLTFEKSPVLMTSPWFSNMGNKQLWISFNPEQEVHYQLKVHSIFVNICYLDSKTSLL